MTCSGGSPGPGQGDPAGLYQQPAMPAARAPPMSAEGLSPTHSSSEQGSAMASAARWKNLGSGLAMPSSSEMRMAEK